MANGWSLETSVSSTTSSVKTYYWLPSRTTRATKVAWTTSASSNQWKYCLSPCSRASVASTFLCSWTAASCSGGERFANLARRRTDWLKTHFWIGLWACLGLFSAKWHMDSWKEAEFISYCLRNSWRSNLGRYWIGWRWCQVRRLGMVLRLYRLQIDWNEWVVFLMYALSRWTGLKVRQEMTDHLFWHQERFWLRRSWVLVNLHLSVLFVNSFLQ